MNVVKVTLATKKVVQLREMKMKFQTLALKAVGNQAKDNQMLAGTLVILELLKILIVDIDGKAPSKQSLEDLDGLFTYKELNQLQTVVGKLMGGDDDAGEIQTEFVLTGEQSPG